MDLHIVITDENDVTLKDIYVYEDGSDAEGAEKLLDLINEHFYIDVED